MIDFYAIAGSVAGAVVGSLGTILAASRTAKPSEAAALTERYTALMDRQTEERKHLEGQVVKLERVAADLEVMVIKLQEWRDEVILYLTMRGHTGFPAPPKFNGGRK